MSTATIAVIAENVVFLAAIITGGHLFRQGGGWQFKTPPVPKTPAAASSSAPKNSTGTAQQPPADGDRPLSVLGGESKGEVA